ncbi:MAG TPA: lysylphosphatidylglycerol synthase transmembrane domain-containing protein [Pirellulaceae bacterium]|nr:lysylphosphatidylglycerol synthase transmembrane domain-containing protein [Pirellulaceae bacterium]
MHPTFKKYALLAVKVGISAALLGYLAYSASQDENFEELVTNLFRGQADWQSIGLAWLICFVSVTITFVRWKLLVQTLGMRFRFRDALRIGAVGYSFNLLPLVGLAGGDLVKMVLLSHLHPTRKTDAVASVLVDRYVGLVALLVLAGSATFLVDFGQLRMSPENQLTFMGACRLIQAAALAGLLGVALLFVPGFTTWSLWKRLEHLPLVGKFVHRLMGALHVYRGRADVLLLTFVMSLGLHSMYSIMFFLLGGALLDKTGVPTPRPELAMHFAFVPIGMAAGSLPLGIQEVALTALYPWFLTPAAASVAQTKGFLLVLLYRVFQIGISGLGLAFSLSSRQELAHLVEEEEEMERIEDEELPRAEGA